MGKYCKFKKSVMHPQTGEPLWEQGESYEVLYETEEGVNKINELIPSAYWFGEFAILKEQEGVVYEVVVIEDAETTEVEIEI